MNDLIIRAAQFAAIHHYRQSRKYTSRPYITHPNRVAMRAAVHPLATPEFVAAAFLHDILEDCEEIYLTDLYGSFGEVVGNLVQELTNVRSHNGDRQLRKLGDRNRLSQVSHEAKVLKLIDRIDNVRELKTGDVEFRTMYYQETILLADILRDADEELYQELIGFVTP